MEIFYLATKNYKWITVFTASLFCASVACGYWTWFWYQISDHISHMDNWKYLDSGETPHGFWCRNCSGGKNCYRECSGTFHHLGFYEQTGVTHWDLGIGILGWNYVSIEYMVRRVYFWILNKCLQFGMIKMTMLNTLIWNLDFSMLCLFVIIELHSWIKCLITQITWINEAIRIMFWLYMVPCAGYHTVGKSSTQGAVELLVNWILSFTLVLKCAFWRENKF